MPPVCNADLGPYAAEAKLAPRDEATMQLGAGQGRRGALVIAIRPAALARLRLAGVLGPLPPVAAHVPEARDAAARRQRADRCGRLPGVFAHLKQRPLGHLTVGAHFPNEGASVGGAAPASAETRQASQPPLAKCPRSRPCRAFGRFWIAAAAPAWTMGPFSVEGVT